MINLRIYTLVKINGKLYESGNSQSVWTSTNDSIGRVLNKRYINDVNNRRIELYTFMLRIEWLLSQ